MNLQPSNLDTNTITSGLFKTLKKEPKRIVFTEGEDIRVLQAAEALVAREIIAPILLGNKDRITQLATDNDINLKFVNVLDPKTAADLPLFCSMLQNIERFKGKKILNPEELISRPHNFAAMMLQNGQADGLVAGNQAQPATIHRALLQFIKPVHRDSKIFTSVIMTAPHLSNFGSSGVLFLADCGIVAEPSVTEVANMAIETGKLALHLLGKTPNIALLSHSTHGSSPSKSAEKMAAATSLARNTVEKEYLDLHIEGEVQADVALDITAAEQKITNLKPSQAADVLIFPNLDSAHITYKILQHVGRADCYGQLVMGLTRQAAQIPQTASVDMIIGTAALVGCCSVRSRHLEANTAI